MFCSQCGVAITESAKFCWKCGMQIAGESTSRHGAGEQSRGFDGLADLVESGETVARSAERAAEAPGATVEPSRTASGPATRSAPAEANSGGLESSSVRSRGDGNGSLSEGRKFLGGSHHPWRRYFAKTLDVVVLGVSAYVLLIIGLGIVAPGTASQLNEALDNQILAAMVVVGLWIPVESMLLATLGTTPARALFGIVLTRGDGSRLNVNEAFVRSFSVAIQGLGAGIPFVTIFTQLFAYQRLTRTGTTLWDEAGDCVVTHIKWSAGRAMACVVVCVLFFAILGALNSAAS